MNRRGRFLSVVRALLAAVLLFGLVVGPPIVLTRVVGWPLPTRMPRLDQLRDILGGSTVDDGTIVKTLALVCWAAWLQVVASALVETYAWVRGTMSRRLPLAGLVQPGVRRLVISVALVLSCLRSGQPAMAASAPVVPVAVAFVEPTVLGAGADVTSSVVQTTPGIPSSPAATVTVKPRDSLWRLAERHLGDGMRWRELWDLNRDRTFPDGRVLRNPNLIQPGWTLMCPSDAVGLDEVAVEEAAPGPEAPPRVRSFTGSPTSSPSNESRPPAQKAATTGSTASVSDPPMAPESQASPDHHREREVPIGLIAGSLVAAGFVALLDRLRRIQLRRRRPGHAPPLIPEAAASETKLRCSAADSPADRLDLALRALGGHLATVGDSSYPRIAVVSVGPEAVEILLTEGMAAKPGLFEVSADGRMWTLPATAPLGEVERLAAGQAAPAPALVTVGSIDDRQVLIDLESSPRLVVTGDHEAAGRTVSSMALEMATSSWADDIEVIVLGNSKSSLDQLERAVVTSDIDDVVERLRRTAATTLRDLEATGAISTMAGRVRNPADPWTPVVLFVPEPLAEFELQKLFGAASAGGGVAVVAAGDAAVPADRELRLEGGSVTLHPLGLHMQAASLTEELLEGVEELLTAALSDEAGEELLARSEDGEPSRIGSLSLVEAERERVLVSVLGPVAVRGGERPIGRRRSLELAVYLALHPEGVDEGRLRAVLWPKSNPSRENFNQTVSRARQPLGHASDGTLHLPRLSAEGARYRLGSAVTSDAALLESAYAVARHKPSDADMENLASILGLIRGIPFEGTKGGWHWTFTEGHAARLASLAADAAHVVAQWLLERGDVQRALWATLQGLRAAPGDEVLYRDRMCAYDVQGNTAGVEAVMDELRRTVEEGEPYDSIHPRTLAYFAHLTQRAQRTG